MMVVAWEGYLSLHKFAGFLAFHLNHSKPFVRPSLLSPAINLYLIPILVVSYKLGQVNSIRM